MIKILIIILLTFLAYGRCLFYGYVCDDQTVADKHDVERILPHKIWYKRWWQKIVGIYSWNKVESHLVSILVHIIVCLTIYYVFGMTQTSFYTALIFSVLPINSQCVAWVSGRLYAVSALLCLLIYAFPFLIILYPLGFIKQFTLISMFSFPFIFWGSPYWFLALIPIMGFFAFKHKIYQKVGSDKGINAECMRIHPKKLVLYFKTLGYYLILSIFPFNIGFDHGELMGIGLNKRYNEEVYRLNRYFWIGIIFVYILITNIIFNPQARIFGLVWFWVTISQWCNILTLTQYVGERYVYLPAIGIALIVGQLFILIGNPWGKYLMIFLVTAYFIRLQAILPMYASEMWRGFYAMIEFKTTPMSYFRQAMIDWRSRHISKAIELLLEARLYCEHDFKINFNLAALVLRMGNIKDAEFFLKVAEDNYFETSKIEDCKKGIADLWGRINEAKKMGRINIKDLIVYE